MDTKHRKYTLHNPRADIEHLYCKKENDGGSLIQLELTNKTITIGLKKYFETTRDCMVLLFNTHKKQKQRIQFVKKAKNVQNDPTVIN